MLYYMLQWLYAHGAAFIAFMVMGMNTAALHPLQQNPPEALANVGFSLPVVYVFWIIGVFLLYPLCKRFADVKKRRSDWWLGYL